MKTSSKKRLVLIVALVLLATLLVPASALAAGHHRGGGRVASRSVQYEQCPFADCDLAYVHEHDGTYYCDNYATGGRGGYGSSRRGGCCGW